MNDPNGMVYYDGEYHLFYQFTPEEIQRPAPKHWGHAVSADLVHWTHLPVALSPDSLGEIWSGSAVVDWKNSSGFQVGEEAVLVALFTHFQDGLQQQSLAYSNDRGRTWTKYPKNPVIPNPGLSDFRDPKVFWHEKTSLWVMVLAAGDQVMIYTSPNLIDWTFASTFGKLHGAHGGVWECPDLFPLKVEGKPEIEKWVLLVSVGSGAPNGGSGSQYFVGSFDGETFANDYDASSVHWIDYGRDYYAGVTFSGLDTRRITIAWMSNWYDAYKVPTTPWRGAMTLPREFRLVAKGEEGLILVSSPVPELNLLRGNYSGFSNKLLGKDQKMTVIKDLSSALLEIQADFLPLSAAQVGIIFSNKWEDHITVGYDIPTGKLFLDRQHAGIVDFEPSFGRNIHSAPLMLDNQRLNLQVILDVSSIEVFAHGGVVNLTDLIFPEYGIESIEIFANGGDVLIENLEAWSLEGIWDYGKTEIVSP